MTFSIIITDNTFIDLVFCYYNYTGHTDFIQIAMTNVSNDNYAANLGTFTAGTNISFYVWANDTSGNYAYTELLTITVKPSTIDSDDDGIPDAYEIANGLNPNFDDANDDLDNDGLLNINEYQLGTYANNSDSDADSLLDGDEVNTYSTDPLDSDTDRDGMPDGWEVNNSLDPLTNDSALDSDSDGLTNLEEYTNNCDPQNNDTDNDILTDGDEVNTYFTDPLNPDTDGDSIPDAWEVNNSLDPLVDDASLDPDSDGLTNLEEYNYGTNPQDSDSDSDGMPDAWEVNNSLDPLVDDASIDSDGDGLTNLEEYQASTDPNDSDTDSDGLTDGEEIKTYFTDPNNSDSDGDGLTDYDEIITFKTDPNNSDSDGDGLTDYDEIIQGLDPNKKNWKFNIKNVLFISIPLLLLSIFIFMLYSRKKKKIKNILQYSQKIDELERTHKELLELDISFFDFIFLQSYEEFSRELIRILLSFANYYMSKEDLFEKTEWLQLKRRINSLLDSFRDLTIKELGNLDVNKEVEQIKLQIRDKSFEDIKELENLVDLSKLDNISNILNKISGYISSTKGFIDEFTFSKLVSYWTNLEKLINSKIQEIKESKQEILKLIDETKELYLNKQQNEQRLETLKKIVSVYNEIEIDKLVFLLKLNSSDALLFWLKKQNLDFQYFVKDDKIIFEKKTITEEQDEISQAIDSLLKRFDEWGKTDQNKKK